jgi:hypothetical protein
MMPRPLALAALVVLGGAVLSSAPQRGQAPQTSEVDGVAIRHVPAAKQYVVNIRGKHFTNYAYGEAFWHKPVFYPVMSPNGVRVNREFPMVAGLPGETADHPHHTSLFFTYDETNGNNFWAASGGSGPRIEQTGARLEGATLVADLLWKGADGQVVFEETRRVTFGGDEQVYWMDHAITLRAPRVPVTMGDTKEGAFGLRVHDALRETKGGTGRYINAEGQEMEAGVWGKPSPWVALRGTVPDGSGPKDVTVAIFAHPKAHNSPPYWHARGYGLFAVNPFGRRGYDPKAPERVTRVGVGEQLALRFRVLVYTGKVDKTRLDQDFATFSR